jgi:hypothetical protein
LRRVSLGQSNLVLNRLFMLTTTSTNEESGTDDTLSLQISAPGLVVDFDLPPGGDTKQEDLETGQANFYEIPVVDSFIKANVTRIRLAITTDGAVADADAWAPRSFFLFGLNDAAGRPEILVPLVHIPSWAFGNMSADSNEGLPSIDLPLAPTP